MSWTHVISTWRPWFLRTLRVFMSTGGLRVSVTDMSTRRHVTDGFRLVQKPLGETFSSVPAVRAPLVQLAQWGAVAGEQVNGTGAHRWFVGTLTLKSQFSEFRQLKVEHLEDDLKMWSKAWQTFYSFCHSEPEKGPNFFDLGSIGIIGILKKYLQIQPLGIGIIKSPRFTMLSPWNFHTFLVFLVFFFRSSGAVIGLSWAPTESLRPS